MTIIRLTGLLASVILMVTAGPVAAITVDDTRDYTNGGADTYFIPPPTADVPNPETVPPYYRYRDQDWDWAHSAIGGAISAASLTITAWDVDNATGDSTPDFEIDSIQIKSGLTWHTLGNLAGASNEFSDTTFDLSGWFSEVNAGLMVRILIDRDLTYPPFWGVSLDKSVLSVTTDLNPVPVPAAVWLFATALAGLAGFSRRKTNT